MNHQDNARKEKMFYTVYRKKESKQTQDEKKWHLEEPRRTNKLEQKKTTNKDKKKVQLGLPS